MTRETDSLVLLRRQRRKMLITRRQELHPEHYLSPQNQKKEQEKDRHNEVHLVPLSCMKDFTTETVKGLREREGSKNNKTSEEWRGGRREDESWVFGSFFVKDSSLVHLSSSFTSFHVILSFCPKKNRKKTGKCLIRWWADKETVGFFEPLESSIFCGREESGKRKIKGKEKRDHEM